MTDTSTNSERDVAPSLLRLFFAGSSRAASQRLAASVENFEADLEYRLGLRPDLRETPWEKTLRSQMANVRAHHKRGEVDAAWRCFTPAARRELEKADPAELVAQADALRREAASGKMSSAWRSALIGAMLAEEHIEVPADEPRHDLCRRVALATRFRDEDADNRYYRVGLLRAQRSLLLGVLVVCIVVVLILAAAVDWSSDLGDPTVGFVSLVAVFGALGACLSAIQSLGHAGAEGRIPEHVATSLITITRPALGAAAALGVYAIAASGLLNISPEGDNAHLTVLAFAFAAGFSERLVLSAVGAATGSTQEK